ncbi:MAG: acyl-CoA dehydrogenase family protein [Alphaproteobacteria bacterium]|jgi:alkylation response protein AidB-like acyl-CoA dehydrogenase|nr:acyl-CoA dehydrogenase family protein [Alphaproteobacteria bacterium]MDP6564014.1 acyl-CoA dehydrogenase family protein [Alphaproteobacteria bacterium]MDP6812211.1 acyl-CoA dehydrogenase family protein [Alphaproteobacteria bacterium]
MRSPSADEQQTDYPARARELGPLIAAAADRAEHDRRLPPELLDALHEAGLFRLLLPRPFDGAELGPPDFFRTIEAVAEVDASTAWCLCQANGCAMSAAYLDAPVAEAIWGDDPRAVLAWGPGANCRALEDGEGYRLSGSWSFISGGHHASWLGGHAVIAAADGTPRQSPEGGPLVRTLLYPADLASVTEIWDVIGLRATGSDNFAVADLPVPGEYALDRDQASARRYRAPLYLFPAMSLYAAGFAGTALGIARAMLEGFKALAVDKRPRLARQVLRDQGMVQAETAQSAARLGAARAFLLSELEDIWAAVVASDELTIDQRMRIRLAATHAIHEAKAVGDAAYELAGATAIFAGNAFERRFRDMHTVVQQLQGRRGHYQTVGAYLLGQPPDLSVI